VNALITRRDIIKTALFAGFSGLPFLAEPDMAICANPARRAEGRRLRAFKRLYFPATLYPEFIEDGEGKFHGPFLDHLDNLVNNKAIIYSAVAAPRGIGKTWDVDIACIYAVCYRLRKMILRIEVEQDTAADRIETLKKIIMTNPLLREDFPEIVNPVLEFKGDARSAKNLKWSSADLKFSNDCKISSRGIEGTIRGFNVEGDRPDFVLINDIESEASVVSEVVCKKLRLTMEKEISALNGQGTRCSFLYTQTILCVGCLADEYTDQKQRPEWNGWRLPAKLSEPSFPQRRVGHWTEPQRRRRV